MQYLDNLIKVLMFCKKYKKEIESIEIDSFLGDVPYDDTHIAIYFENGNSVGIFNTVYEINEEEEQIGFTNIEEVLDNIVTMLKDNAVVKVGDIVQFNMASDDEDLEQWICEQAKKGITEFEVIESYVSTQTFYLKNCEYAVSFNDNFIVKEKKQ